MKTINIDLKEIKTKEQLLNKIGESLEFGDWGMNWDALNDSLRYLDKGGIFGTSKILDFPMTVNFLSCAELKRDDPQSFSTLNDIFTETHYKLKKEGKVMWTHFKSIFCPCCGQTVCDELGDYSICDVCGWENDLVQEKDPDMAGGANTRSLNEERKRFQKGRKNC